MLEGAEGSMVLTDAKPGDRPRHAKGNRATHATEFDKGDKSTRAEGVPELRTPTGITVGGKTTKAMWGRRDGVVVALGFSIRCIWVVEVGVERLVMPGGEVDAHVMSGVDVLEGVEGGLHVAKRPRAHDVRG